MRCLSRMSGNLQVRFLGGGAVATRPATRPVGDDATAAERTIDDRGNIATVGFMVLSSSGVNGLGLLPHNAPLLPWLSTDGPGLLIRSRLYGSGLALVHLFRWSDSVLRIGIAGIVSISWRGHPPPRARRRLLGTTGDDEPRLARKASSVML